MATRGTLIADLQAQHNARMVIAEGALYGERRAAVARLAMVAMFGLVTQLRPHHFDPVQFGIGAAYTLFGAVTLYMVYRRAKPDPARAALIPIALTAVDFAFLTTMAMLNVFHGEPFSGARHAIGCAIVMAFSVARYSTWHVVGAALAAIASYAIASGYGGELATNISVFVIAGYLVLGLMLAITNRAVRRMFDTLRQRDNLTRFLPSQVAERVMATGPSALAPVVREVTVMFSDIRGFTAMSEGLAPRDLLAFLDDYFGQMGQIVKGHDGVVGKLMGDGLLAYWGVPDRVPDHAVRAVRAARDMRRVLVELNAHRARDGHAPIRIGIGIHTGTVAAGMLGGALQSEYTVIGDAVNVASRIEGLTKEHGVDVLVSETTWAQLPEPRAGAHRGASEIRGRKEPVGVYTVE